MKDRFFNGFIAGVVAGLVPFAVNWGTRALELTTAVWVDFLGLFILGRRPDAVLENIFLIGVQFVFLGLLGAVFALILPHISSKRHLFSAVYGAAGWFFLFSLPSILQLGQLERFPVMTAAIHLTGAILWGIAMAFVLKWLDSRASRNLWPGGE